MATPLTWTTPSAAVEELALLTTNGRSATTFAVIVSSTARIAPSGLYAMVRIVSPVRMSGVTPSQQPPPGWLTSTMPANGASSGARGSCWGMTLDVLTTTGAVCVSYLRSTCTRTVSVGRKPLLETKSRDGNEMICTGAAGGLCTTVPAGSVATCWTVVALAAFDSGERLPTASAASTV